MSRPKPWDGFLWVHVMPISGGGWYFAGAYRSKTDAERARMTPIDRIFRQKVWPPKVSP